MWQTGRTVAAEGPATRRGPTRAALSIVAAVLATLAVIRQPAWPATWIDEGFVMAGAMSVATRGEYALPSSDGLRRFDQPLIANGPGVVLPVAASFRVFGVGLRQARAVAAIALVAAGLLAYTASVRVGGSAAGVVALAVVIAMPREGLLYFGRMAMGNVPALAYFLAGALLWMRALDVRERRLAWAAGLCFGLAAITKAQWSVVLLPSLAAIWIVDRLTLRAIQLRLVIAAAAGLAGVVTAWYLTRRQLLGLEGFALDLARVQDSARWTVFAWAPFTFGVRATAYLVRSGIAVVVAFGLGFTVWLAYTRDRTTPHALLFAVTSVVWLAWYVVASVGWERYAFEPMVLAALVASGGVVHLWRLSGDRMAARLIPRLAAAAALIVFALIVALHATHRGHDLLFDGNDAAQDVAAFLDQHAAGALVETWEWPLAVLTRAPLHFPTNDWVDRYTAQTFARVPIETPYDWGDLGPSYLVDGPFSKFTGLYAPMLKDGCCDRLLTTGPYDVYRVRAAEPAAW